MEAPEWIKVAQDGHGIHGGFWTTAAATEDSPMYVRADLVDNPAGDGTDYAHPAWWRGHKQAVEALCVKIDHIIRGKDRGDGIANPPWEVTRRELLRLCDDICQISAERDILKEENQKLRDAADRISPYLRWTISDESPGYHPTMPSAVAAFHATFGIETAESRMKRFKERSDNG